MSSSEVFVEPSTKSPVCATRGSQRREFLKVGAGALAAPFVMSGTALGQADRAAKVFLVSLPDASVEKIVQEHVAPLMKRRFNAEIRTQQSASSTALSAMRVQRRQPSFLAVTLDLSYAIQALDEGLAEPVSTKAIPHLSDVMPEALAEDGKLVSFLLSTDTLCFNRSVWPKAPASYADIFADDKVGKLAAGSPSTNVGLEFLAAASSAATGKPIQEAANELDIGIRHLAKYKNRFKMVYSRAQEVLPLLASGEVGTCFVKTRFLTDWVQRGAALDCVIPKEGAFYSMNCLVPVKNSPDPELAMAFIDAMLSPEIQALWPTRIGSAAVNRKTTAHVPSELRNIVPTPAQIKTLKLLPELSQKQMADLSKLYNELVAR